HGQNHGPARNRTATTRPAPAKTTAPRRKGRNAEGHGQNHGPARNRTATTRPAPPRTTAPRRKGRNAPADQRR
ncbi:hypothetical protein, partial [Streptomyces sp. NPDC003023]|uniref:hypothetical protein n=1 Tax=Streptomyces sp. NPDC003023 TaxID=3364675 RepID=UPI00368B84DC